jgi:hypothetical protein
MPPIITKITTGGDKMIRSSQNKDSFVIVGFEDASMKAISPNVRLNYLKFIE